MQQDLTPKKKAIEVPKGRTYCALPAASTAPPLRCSCPAAHLAACMRAQDIKVRPKKPRRQRLPWMKDDEGTPAASGDLLTAAAATATAAATEVAMAAAAAEVAMAAAAAEAAAVAMAATETEPAEAAEVVQARSLPLPSLCAPTTM